MENYKGYRIQIEEYTAQTTKGIATKYGYTIYREGRREDFQRGFKSQDTAQRRAKKIIDDKVTKEARAKTLAELISPVTYQAIIEKAEALGVDYNEISQDTYGLDIADLTEAAGRKLLESMGGDHGN